MIIGDRCFSDKNHTGVMGILNVTPDSFYDGGKYMSLDCLLDRAEQMIAEGAEIIDIGAESTRPGAVPVGTEEEVRRLLPAVYGIKKLFNIPVSVDTYNPLTARKVLCAGADMINDVGGLRGSGILASPECPKMAEIIAEYDASVCIMHNSRESVRMSDEACDGPKDLVGSIISELEESVSHALACGIRPEKICIDPGIGFGKSSDDSLKIMAELKRLTDGKYPVLLGTSNKSFIGVTLGLPKEERIEGTLATTALAVMAGCRFVRVHNIKENVRLIKMLEAIRGKG